MFKVELFPGVDEWFERVRQYGDKNGVIIEHYIISSGLKEMIEGTKMLGAAHLKRFMRVPFIMMKMAWQFGRHRQ